MSTVYITNEGPDREYEHQHRPNEKHLIVDRPDDGDPYEYTTLRTGSQPPPGHRWEIYDEGHWLKRRDREGVKIEVMGTRWRRLRK